METSMQKEKTEKKPLVMSIHDFNTPTNTGNTTNANNGNNNGSFGGITNPFSAATPQQTSSDDNDALIDYNEAAKNGRFSPALFRDDQINQTLSVLASKRKPNALLTGPAGVGKTQIVEEIARRLEAKDTLVTSVLGHVKIYELSLSKLVSSSGIVGQLEEKVHDVLSFLKNPKNKAILFIDEIHQLTSGDSVYNKITQILKPELGRGQIKVIGATTAQEAITFMRDPAFSRRWSEIHIPELSQQETKQILEALKYEFEKFHNVIMTDNIIEEVVLISDEYKRYGSHRPDSAITLMDKAMSDTRIERAKLIEQAKKDPNLQLALQQRPRPVVTITQLKKSALKLLTGNESMFEQNMDMLELTLNDQIIGQNEAKAVVVDAAKRLALRLTARKRPSSFLFAGPSGTGKTEMAKQIAISMFGSKTNMITINMSEFSNESSLNRIIGSPVGYIGSDSKEEFPFDSLEQNPYQLILIDEYEKADPKVQRFFMQALDEGTVKTNRNKDIDFSRALIIMTTNAGVIDMSKKSIGFGQEQEQVRSTDEIIRILNAQLDIEVINRFEKIVAFTSIDKDQYTQILGVKYNSIVEEIKKNRRDLNISPLYINPSDALVNDTLKRLADESYTLISNGRPAERTMRQYIENEIINNPNNTQFTLL